jgi:SAM-dependent methyltransferase/ADP-ribose pyrophosphatase YjhB (NUDIX family)
MPEILSLALFERGGQTLLARRKSDRPPFAGQWMLPASQVTAEQSAEEALENHAYRELGVEVANEEFVETLYLADATNGERFVANVFRVGQFDGQLRFRSAGDYEDARWLARGDIASVDVPPGLREWLTGPRRASIAPSLRRITANAEGAFDNRTAWNTISRAYQGRYRVSTKTIEWAPRLHESDLQLLGNVSGLDAIVLGCGGGQDCIVLAKQGASVVGIDLSDRQIEYAKRLAEREGVLVTLLQGNAEDLKQIEDETRDLAISAHAMNYVERPARAFAEAYRVLRPGSALIISVDHPLRACLEGDPPFAVQKSYWESQEDWRWEFSEANVAGNFRSWHRTVSDWHSLITGAGFSVQQVLEPRPPEEGQSAWDGSYDRQLMQLIPMTLIMKAVKP